MNIDIEFKRSSTGSYSPWHLDIADKYNVPLMCTADLQWFVKIGDDIYAIYKPYDHINLYEYFVALEEKNDKGELSDEETLKELDDIVNNRNENFNLRKCIPLAEFEEKIKERSKKNEEKI